MLPIVIFLVVNAVTQSAGARLWFKNDSVQVHMGDTKTIPFQILKGDETFIKKQWLQLESSNENVATITKITLNITELPVNGSFNVTGVFLGKSSITFRDVTTNSTIPGELSVIVVRQKRLVDTIFTISVISLVSIIYINFGCALNWSQVKATLKRPIGPAIGVIGHFAFMPILSYGLGRALFPDNPELQLGMFFTGVSPAGGASNMWTAILDGNVDLSITMTTISTLASFLMMPLWIFTLGQTIFQDAKLEVPYKNIAGNAAALFIPLIIGLLLRRFCQRAASFMARILKGFSSLLILFIVVFATLTNLYLFKLFSWQIVLAGMGLPYLGFLLAFIIATVLRLPNRDILAISVETGIQNSGIAIFMLRLSLEQPDADLTTVCPVAVSVMTPFPLLAIYIYKKIRARLYGPTKLNLDVVEPQETQKCFTVIREE